MWVLEIVWAIYSLSAIAVYIWHHKTSGTAKMSWVGNREIFLPIYNTVVAIELWKEHNPYK